MYKQSIKTVKLSFYWLLLILSILLLAKTAHAEESIDICQAITKTDNIDALTKWKKENRPNISLDEIDCNGRSLLRIAISDLSKRGEFSSTIRSTRYDNLIWLLDNKIDVNQEFYAGGSVLDSVGDVNLLYLLVEKGAKINVKNDYGTTPIGDPFIHPESLNLLLHLGAEPEFGEFFDKTALDEAVVSCSFERAEILLKHGAKIPRTLSEYRLLLNREKRCVNSKKQLIIFNLLAKYQRLRTKTIAEGANPDRLTFNPPPPPKRRRLPSKQDPTIVEATRENDIETVKKLIAAGTNLDAISKSGEAYSDLYSATALHIALSLKHKEIAKLLIESGANLTIHNAAGHHPLYLAAYDYELTKLLLDHGALVEQGGGSKCEIPALMSDYLSAEVADLLLQNGAQINETKCRIYTPLYVAIENENISLVKLLVERGANVNLNKDYNYYQYFPLYQATESNQAEIVAVLIKNGATAGLSQAYTEAVSEEYPEIEMLLEPALTIDFTPRSLFLKSIYGEKIPLFKKLLNEGFGNYLKTDEGSELLVASTSKNSKIMKILLENSVNVNAKSELRSVTALHKAAFWGKLDKVKLLLSYGAKAKVEDREDQSPSYMVISGVGKKRLSQGKNNKINYRISPLLFNPIFGQDNNDQTYYRIPQRLEIFKLLLKEEQHLTKLEYGKLLNLVQKLKKSKSEEIVTFAEEAYFILRKYKPQISH